jgi:acyl carrier protein
LYEDLDLDSIDAVDLVVKLRAITGKKIDPEAFKKVRTVEDVVIEVEKLVNG